MRHEVIRQRQYLTCSANLTLRLTAEAVHEHFQSPLAGCDRPEFVCCLSLDCSRTFSSGGFLPPFKHTHWYFTISLQKLVHIFLKNHMMLVPRLQWLVLPVLFLCRRAVPLKRICANQLIFETPAAILFQSMVAVYTTLQQDFRASLCFWGSVCNFTVFGVGQIRFLIDAS